MNYHSIKEQGCSSENVEQKKADTKECILKNRGADGKGMREASRMPVMVYLVTQVAARSACFVFIH